jgi:AmmeMemoRadiSam system protein B
MVYMAQRLPRLRGNLDFMGSPVPDRPGLLIRDSLRYSDTTLIIPPLLVECLRFFDGESTDLDLRQMLVQATGDLRVGEAVENLIQSLSQAGFLEDEVYARLKEEKQRSFAASPVREASHAGAAYPAEADELRAQLDRCLNHQPSAAAPGDLVGLAAPHVSLEGGSDCYQAAYGILRPEHKERTFVILGTSHYGQPEKFGLTRKPYATPLGEAVTDGALVDELSGKAGGAVTMEDYCHAVEHSIEFQVLFLQHVLGPRIRILPILCGPFAHSLMEGGAPEDDPGVGAFLGALREIAARERARLFWILGIDLAHIGPRYGDNFAAAARRGVMAEVEEHDRSRLERVAAGDAKGLWERIRPGGDGLRWCGASVLYAFLKAVPEARGEVLRYSQWNIDERSVVSFGAIAFRREPYSGTAAIQ